jgi:hypothetical protein
MAGSFLDTIAPDTGTGLDPLTGLPRATVARSPEMYGDDGSPNYWATQSPDAQPTAAAPASPAAAAPTSAPVSPMYASTGEEPGLDNVDMGADAGDEVGRSFVQPAVKSATGRPAGYTGGYLDNNAGWVNQEQADTIDNMGAANPTSNIVPAKNYNRVGGQDASQFMAGMSPAAQAAIQALMRPSPDAYGSSTGGPHPGQTFLMPGGNFVPAGAAMRAAQGADAQTAQAQEQAQRVKADAWKQANGPAALETLRNQGAMALQKQKDDAQSSRDWESFIDQQSSPRGQLDQIAVDTARRTQAEAPTAQESPYDRVFNDAKQRLQANPGNVQAINDLKTSFAGTSIARGLGGATTPAAMAHLQSLMPSAGTQTMAGLGTASKVLDGSPDIKQQLAQLAQTITTGHMSTEQYYQLRQQRAAIEQQMVQRGSDPQSAHIAVKAALQQGAPSFIQAPASQGAFGRGVEDLATSGNSLGQILDLPGTIAGMMANSHRQDIEERQLKASFLNE